MSCAAQHCKFFLFFFFGRGFGNAVWEVADIKGFFFCEVMGPGMERCWKDARL